MWTAANLLLEHIKAPVHTALSIRQFLAKHSIPSLHLTPHLPILFYSLNSKLPLRGKHFKRWKTSSLTRRKTLRRYHKHPSNNDSRNGKGGGRGAVLSKRVTGTLKGIVFNML
jgi:hypothetical protein